jgi:hypothetical protein
VAGGRGVERPSGLATAARPPLEALPGLTTAALVAVSAAAGLFWLSLVSYRHSVPVEVLSPLAQSAVALTAAALVLLAVGIDAVLFPRAAAGSPPPSSCWRRRPRSCCPWPCARGR